MNIDLYPACLVRFVTLLKHMSRFTTKPTKWHVCPVKVHMKKAWVLSYPLSEQQRLIRLGWSGSSLGAQSFCWFCHEAAHIWFKSFCLVLTVCRNKYGIRPYKCPCSYKYPLLFSKWKRIPPCPPPPPPPPPQLFKNWKWEISTSGVSFCDVKYCDVSITSHCGRGH